MYLMLLVVLSSLQMADTIDINFQSDLMAIFEENLFWEGKSWWLEWEKDL